jgi:hypothetical protein
VKSITSGVGDMSSTFLAIARDPRIIPGVHLHCDEWCPQCPVTTRCLGFRCTEEFRRLHKRRPGDETFRDAGEALAFTRLVAAVEGLPTHELDALTAGGASNGMQTSDPLVSVAEEYAVRVALHIGPATAETRESMGRMEPPPKAVVLWYHVRIYLRVGRALVARERTLKGLPVTPDEAAGSGKLVLVSIERSRRALQALRTRETADEIRAMLALLDELEVGIDERLPAARSFVRFGLDVPAAPA